MSMTSLDIQNQNFALQRRGYDIDEVDIFLEQVANALDDLNDQIENLSAGVVAGFGVSKDAQFKSNPIEDINHDNDDLLDEIDLLKEENEKLQATIVNLEKAISENKADGRAIAQALIVAQRSGDEIIANASFEAERTIQNADEEAQRIIEKAIAEKERIIENIQDLEDESEDIRQDYQAILRDFIDSASTKLTEISALSSFTPKKVVTTKEVAVEKPYVNVPTGAYSVPATSGNPVVVPATPMPSAPSKDLSGFGESDSDFTLDELD